MSDFIGPQKPRELTLERLNELPRILEYRGEFGSEIACYVPTIYWLHRNNLLGERTVSSYAGMQPFYFFLPPERFLPISERRVYVPAGQRPWYLANRDEHRARKRPLECWPDYRAVYGSMTPRFAKPLLVVQNKYANEWNLGPVNFIGVEQLDLLFSRFKAYYQIVYFREGLRDGLIGYSPDRSTPMHFPDREILDKHPEVLVFDDLLVTGAPPGGYNELKLQLFAHCWFFVTSQGGGSYPCALFSNSTIILMHRAGRELRHSYSHGVYRHMASPSPKLLIARDNSQFEQLILILSRTLACGQPAPPKPLTSAELMKFEPLQQMEPRHEIKPPETL